MIYINFFFLVVTPGIGILNRSAISQGITNIMGKINAIIN